MLVDDSTRRQDGESEWKNSNLKNANFKKIRGSKILGDESRNRFLFSTSCWLGKTRANCVDFEKVEDILVCLQTRNLSVDDRLL